MSGLEPTRQHMREAFFFCFNLKKSGAESHHSLQEAYGKCALSETTCSDLFRRFKNGDFNLEDKERPEQPKKFEDEDLKALIKITVQTLKQLSDTLNVTKTAVSKCLHNLELV